MSSKKKWTPVTYRTLSGEIASLVTQLRDRCNAAGGLCLKIGVPAFAPPERVDADAPGTFFVYAMLVYNDDSLAGYCSLEGNRESVEICGMVAPGQRRQGIGAALLDGALAYCSSAGVQETLLICEEASSEGKAFAAAHAGSLQFSEHRMELRDFEAMERGLFREPRLSLRRAGPEESGMLAEISSRVFGGEAELASIRADIEQELDSAAARFYVGELEGVGPVSSLKLYLTSGQASVYAFGVLPQYRRQGLAWQTLALLVREMLAEGISEIGLEVETNNGPALALYQASGFVPMTTYGYYRLEPRTNAAPAATSG